MFYFLLVLFALACIGVIYFVLIQEPKQGGLSGGLGGAGGGGDFLGGRGVQGGLVRITVILAVIFLALAIGLNLIKL
jgi:preprotein translocase subunit SecG